MEKQKKILKWIFETMSDDGLVSFVKKSKMPIDGFRTEKISIRDATILRPRVLKTITSKPNPTIRHFNSGVERDEGLSRLREMDIDDIKREIDENKITLADALISLISASEEEAQSKGIFLYDWMVEKSDIATKDEGSQTNERTQIDDKELIKANETIDLLRRTLEETHQKYEKDRETWKTEKAELQGRVKDLERRVSEKDESLRRHRDMERKLRESLEESECALSQAKDQIVHLQVAGKRLNEELKVLEKRLSDQLKKKILLIGDKSGRAQDEIIIPNFEIVSVQVEELDNVVKKGLIESANEVWILSYNINWTSKRTLNQLISGGKRVDFESFNQLRDYIEKHSESDR